MSAFTRCKFTWNLRLVIAVMCVPMPPVFFALPERQMMLPFIGRLPVNSQILAIKFLLLKGRTDYRSHAMLQALFPQICVPLAGVNRIFAPMLWLRLNLLPR